MQTSPEAQVTGSLPALPWYKCVPRDTKKLEAWKQTVIGSWTTFGQMLYVDSPFFLDTEEGRRMRCQVKRFAWELDKGVFTCVRKIQIPDSVKTDYAYPAPEHRHATAAWMGVKQALTEREFFQHNTAGDLVRYQVSIAFYNLSRWRWQAAAHAVCWRGRLLM